MIVPPEQSATDQIMDSLRGVLLELELTAAEDAAIPGFVLSFPIRGKAWAFTLEVPAPDLLFLTAHLPGEIPLDQALHALVFSNEVNRHCRLATLMLDGERRQLCFRYARAMDALPDRGMVGSLIKSAHDFAGTLSAPLHALIEENAEWSTLMNLWTEVRDGLNEENSNSASGSDAAKTNSTPIPRFQIGNN